MSVSHVVHLNLAAIYLAEGNNMEKVHEHCDLALAIEKDNVKALYRKGQACLRNGNCDAAATVLKKAVAAQPNDKAIRQVFDTYGHRTSTRRGRNRVMIHNIYHSSMYTSYIIGIRDLQRTIRKSQSSGKRALGRSFALR